MTTELHLIVRAESAMEALVQLIEVGQRAAIELGVAPQLADIAGPPPATEPASKGNGADGAPVAKRRGRPPQEAPPGRNEIIRGLTEIFIAGDAGVQARIKAFRDGHGAQRLWELGDAALPEAARLLDELGEP